MCPLQSYTDLTFELSFALAQWCHRSKPEYLLKKGFWTAWIWGLASPIFLSFFLSFFFFFLAVVVIVLENKLSSLASSCADRGAAGCCREESDSTVWMRLSLLIEHERSAEDNKLTVVDTAHDVHTLQEEPKFTVKIRRRGGQR
jgi:hypothetical protein